MEYIRLADFPAPPASVSIVDGWNLARHYWAIVNIRIFVSFFQATTTTTKIFLYTIRMYVLGYRFHSVTILNSSVARLGLSNTFMYRCRYTPIVPI